METTLHTLSSNTLPFEVGLSFRPFVTYLKSQRESDSRDGGVYGLYSYLIDQFEQVPACAECPEAVIGKDRLTELFQLASVAVLPLTAAGQYVPYAFGLPMPLTLFYQSDAFTQLMSQFPGLLSELPNQLCQEDKLRYMYLLILKKCYGVDTVKKAIPSFRFQKQINGLTKYFRMDINTSFIEPRLGTYLPPLQPVWIDYANGTGQLPEGISQLPVEEFSFEGFSFFRVEDITETETIQQLHEVFAHLQSDTEPIIYSRFEAALRDLCGQPDLKISLLPVPKINGRYVHHPDSMSRSVSMRHWATRLDDDKDAMVQKIAVELIQNPTPYLFPDLLGLPDRERQVLQQQGIRSFLVYPIATANEFLGMLEMGSPRPNAFNEGVLATIDRIVPLIQELLRYQLHQFNDSLEQLIKKQFTSLQPSVEWKFYEAAWQSIRRGQNSSLDGETMVAFPQVYPLYGAVDVRDSSVERQKAVRQDMLDQLKAIEELLDQAGLSLDAARLKSLRTGCQHWQTKLDSGLRPDDEVAIAQFLNEEVNPYLQRLLLSLAEGQPPVQRYFDRTDPQTGQFGQALNAYERSLNRINATVNDYINQEEKQLQTIYPHYFERYRTDGTEYTIYAGQSIAPDQPFERDYRRRLSEWQLSSMVEMAQLTHRLLPHLPLPLRTTQLILVHSHPVDISFRPDERRFDVEGSYSIRYEVLKKRIDKAFIDGTQERLTQPDTIGLVYTHSTELVDYLSAITRLQQQGSLQPGIEYVDLEPLQGVSNLKALRVRINYNDDGPL
ncbi:MAG: GAF domain-containing protein [Bacteroidetes bacterium]|nr:GAF domain-containing protein [Fibrella sp.]